MLILTVSIPVFAYNAADLTREIRRGLDNNLKTLEFRFRIKHNPWQQKQGILKLRALEKQGYLKLKLSKELKTLRLKYLNKQKSLELKALKNKTIDLNVDYKTQLSDFQIEQNQRNKLLHYKSQFNAVQKKKNQWGKSEQAIFYAKQKLQAIQNKLKAEGDWGMLKLNMQGLKGKDPGAVKIKYKYGF